MSTYTTSEKTQSPPAYQLVIEPQSRWSFLNVRDLWQYRDLLLFIVWRDIRVRYAQSILGVGWAVIQPFFQMIVFTLIFGNLVNVSSEGAPYAIFSYTALVPWTYFSNTLNGASLSLISATNLISKVYFPRIILPLAAVLDKLVDTVIALILLFFLMIIFQVTPTPWIIILPALMGIAVLTSAGLGLLFSALAVQYRDVAYSMRFATTILMYFSPVIYPANLIPDKYRLLYALNPMVGVIEGFRSALLDTNPMPWNLIGIGAVMAIVLLVTGAFYFGKREHVFADVV